MDCSPSTYLHTAESFETACLTGQRQGKVKVTYDPSIPQRAVHLLRNPIDNMVGRMHLFNKHHRADRLNDFNTSLVGIEAWCDYLDEKYAAKESSHEVLRNYSHVPCHAEWYRYIQWHNLAWQVSRERLQLPVHYLYYEDYGTRATETIQELMEFLRETAVAPMLEFRVSSKKYRDFLADSHIEAATKMMQELALPGVWKLLERYLA